MYELRDYQKETVEKSVAYLNQKKKVQPGVVVVPTAGGKALCIGSVVKAINRPTLILQPSKEILQQNVEKARAFGMDPKIYSASVGIKEIGEITYATLKSVKKSVQELKNIGIKDLLVDEAHFGYSPDSGSEFMKFIKEMGDVRVLGFTATPCRLHTYGSLVGDNYSMLNMLTQDYPRFFKNIVHVVQIKDLVEKGFWSKVKYEIWDFDESELVKNTSGSEFTMESIKKAIEKSGLNNTIYIRIVRLLKERKHILACMDSVETCNVISEFMNKKFGNISAVVTSETKKKDRERIIKEFKEGKLKVVYNYSTLNTGFDFPELDCVIMGRPTMSFAVYYQTVGRGLRIHPEKEDCLFVDCCNNHKRFGKVEDVTVERNTSKGWCMFSGDQLLTGVRMDTKVTRQDLASGVKPGSRKVSPMDSKVMLIGKYQGKKYLEIPVSYWMWIVDNMPKGTSLHTEASKYLNSIIA